MISGFPPIFRAERAFLRRASSRRFGACVAVWLLSTAGLTGCHRSDNRNSKPPTLLNVSFDVSRELFGQLNTAAKPLLKAKAGHVVEIAQSHGGASKQARSVIDGVDADVITLNTVSDVDLIARRGQLLPREWRSLKPFNSSPYSSVIVLVVRKGNPKQVHNWPDLVQPGIRLVLPNPKTSGTARMVHLSAWSHAMKSFGGDETKAQAYMAAFYAHAPILDTGSRGATITFVQRQLGDVLLTLEAEQRIVAQEYKQSGYEVIYPEVSLEVEMPVAVVERVARKHNTLELANAYVDFLYSPEAQEIIARNHFRPRDRAVLAKYATNFPPTTLIDVDRDLGGWDAMMAKHFGEGGVFDKAYDRKR